MWKFVVRRFLASLLALIGATILVFGVSRLLGDPRALLLPEGGYGLSQQEWEAATRRLHLDKPVVVQYGYWLWDLVRGDLGQDLADRSPIAPKLRAKFFPTAKLAVSAWILSTIIGIPLGVLSAVKRGTVWDYLGRGFALFGQTLPTFWLGIVAILVFAVWLGWLPTGTMGEGLAIRNYILPTATLAWLAAAGYLRLTRSAMLEVLDSEYIKLARAKGLNSWAIIWKHAFKNAAIAPLTYSGLLLAGFITGSIAVETVFSWPGLARYAVEAVWNNNFTVLAVVTLIFTLGYVMANFLVDVLYGYIDPRIRYT